MAFAAVPYQRADLTSLELTASECHARLQWIGDVTSPTTTRESGARAVGAMMRAGGRSALIASRTARPPHPEKGALPDDVARGDREGSGRRPMWRLTARFWICLGSLTFTPPTSWIASALYRAVAANRHALPGGTPACHL